MFESIEIRKVKNGIIISVNTHDGDQEEYVFDTARKAMKFVKEFVEADTKSKSDQ